MECKTGTPSLSAKMVGIRVFFLAFCFGQSHSSMAQAVLDLKGGKITGLAPAESDADAVNLLILRTEVDARRAAVAAEAQARAIQDDRLQQAIANESATRVESDRNLLLLVSNADLNSDLIRDRFDAEAIGRTAAIAAEAEARIAGDARVVQLVDREGQLRSNGDGVLAARIDAESLARLGALAVETEQRIAGDRALGLGLDAERSARVAGDDALHSALQTETQQRTAALAQEATARTTADAALGNRIDTEASQRKQGDAILGNRIASSTATAIAMGGALVLPDYDFTLSANAGFYEGAQAIAINGAARVSDNAYVTGALGGGLNKRGAVGARVGFAVGF